MAAAELIFGIRDWFAWKPGLESRAAWIQAVGPVPGEALEEKNPIALPMMLRRRMSSFGQQVVGGALAIPAVAQSPYIFATRHGEFTTTLRILEALYQRVMPSPADFSMSVHHALAGLMSIHTGNKAGHTTISAGLDTFGYGLLEAVTTVLEGRYPAALLVSYDEPLPGPYAHFQGPEESQLPLVAILDIVEPALADRRFRLTIRPCDNEAKAVASEGENDMDLPMGQRFLQFFLSGQPQAELVGETMIWACHRVA
jgi:hypothetical protein